MEQKLGKWYTRESENTIGGSLGSFSNLRWIARQSERPLIGPNPRLSNNKLGQGTIHHGKRSLQGVSHCRLYPIQNTNKLGAQILVSPMVFGVEPQQWWILLWIPYKRNLSYIHAWRLYHSFDNHIYYVT